MSSHQATMVLFGLGVIILLARLLGHLARRLGQPPVIGEILAGILLGPTLFGGAVAGTMFPPDVRPFLGALASVGVALFMFLVGLELDQGILRGRGRVAASVATGSILVPFALGVSAAFLLIRSHPVPSTLSFVLYLGVAMAVTAFPVLARILTDRDLHRTFVGSVALTSAAIGDVLAWLLLAGVIALTGGTDQWRVLLVVPYVVICYWVVRPQLRRLAAARTAAGHLSLGVLAVVTAGLLISAALTEWMGLHYIFGAFLFGVIMPRVDAAELREEIALRIGSINGVLLLPVFFVVAGFKVDLSTIGTSGLWELGLILLVAMGGKLTGAYVGARVNRVPGREAATLAVLMNTRGLTELIVLGVGLDAGLLDRRLYTLMVVMAVVTTAMAGPLLSLIGPAGVAVAEPSGVTPPSISKRTR